MGLKDSMKRKNKSVDQIDSGSSSEENNGCTKKVSRQTDEIKVQTEGSSIGIVDAPHQSERENNNNATNAAEARTESQDEERIESTLEISCDNIKDDYENREENPLLNQIEYIWSGISYTSSQSSATIDMKDRHYMVKRKKGVAEADSEVDQEDDVDEDALAMPIGTCSPFSDCISPRHEDEPQKQQRQRTVQFLSPLVTDVQTSYRVPNHEKHKFYYTANNIRFFREEYEYESQPSCASSFADFFTEHYDHLCSVSVPQDQQVISPVNAKRLELDAKKLAEQTKDKGK